jgi:DNA-binding beta-propeller fold protein YncE
MPYGSGKYTYELVEGWTKLPEGWSFKDVGGLVIDAEDRIHVLNRSDHPVIVFDAGGNVLTTWGEGVFNRAHGSGLGPDGAIYCTDDGHHTVFKFSPEGKLLMTLGNMDTPSDTGYREVPDLFERISTITFGGPPFNRPTGVAVSGTGEIFVCDGYGNARVHRFNPDGQLLASWGGPGPGPGQFRLPHSIWMDKQDRVWIADRENSRLQIFAADGEFIDQWTDLIRPTDLCIDDRGVVYVSELCKRVSIFASDGSYYKADRGSRALQKFARV